MSDAPDGRTHHADCYSTRGHHDCAVLRVERLQKALHMAVNAMNPSADAFQLSESDTQFAEASAAAMLEASRILCDALKEST